MRAVEWLERSRAGRVGLLYFDRNGPQAAAAAAFWSAFALPWLLLALQAAALRLDRRIGGVSAGLETAVRDWIGLAVPSPSVQPFLDDLFGILRAEAVADFGLVAGFILILSGTAITGGLIGGTARLCGRSLGHPLFGSTVAGLKTYATLLLVLAISLPILVRGPAWLSGAWGISTMLAEDLVAVLAGLVLASAFAAVIYRAACPDLGWRTLAPGVAISVMSTACCIAVLWAYLKWTFAEHSVLDAVAAPVGVLLACFAVATAVLVGGAWIASATASADEPPSIPR